MFGQALGQHRHQNALAGGDALADLGQQVIDLGAGRPHFDGRIDQAGRPHQLFDHLALMRFPRRSEGVAETNTVCGISFSNSSNFSGRLSSAEGRRKPKSTRLVLARAVALEHAADCGIVTCDSSTNMSASGGR
jgi:hypothetical protein